MSASTIEEVVIGEGHGREPAICELTCLNCGDGMKFDQFRCLTCGGDNPRYVVPKSLGEAVERVHAHGWKERG